MPWITTLKEGGGFAVLSADGKSDVIVVVGTCRAGKARVHVQTRAAVKYADQAPPAARARIDKLSAAAMVEVLADTKARAKQTERKAEPTA